MSHEPENYCKKHGVEYCACGYRSPAPERLGEWGCGHVKTIQGLEMVDVIDGVTKEIAKHGLIMSNLWKFCPICAAPRPEPKFIPTAKLDENNDLIIYGKDKAWKFDGIAFRQIVNKSEPYLDREAGGEK